MKNISINYILKKSDFFSDIFGDSEIKNFNTNFIEAIEAANEKNHNAAFCYYYIEKQYIIKNKGKSIILSEEEVALHEERQAIKKASFDYKKDSLCFGIYHHWDGSKERFFMLMTNSRELEICFPDDKTKMKIKEARLLNLRGQKDLNRCFCLSEGEELHVLGGDEYWATKVPVLSTGYGSIPAVEDED